MSQKNITSAMVLAAGLGKRMRPLSDKTPKPLLEVANKPMIDWALDALGAAGVKKAVVNLHHLGEQIESHLKAKMNNERPSPAISFINEDPVLETGGGILNAIDKGLLGGGAFYALNADQIWLDDETPAIKHLSQVWDENKMDALLLLQPTSSAFGYDGVGDFNLGPGGILERKHPGASGELVFTGVQIIHPRLFELSDEIKAGDVFSLNVLYDRAIKTGRLYGIVHDGEWLHMGTPAALDAANEFLLKRNAQ